MENINLDEILKFKDQKVPRSNMHTQRIIQWLRKRKADQANKKYLFLPEELNEQAQILEIFNFFDQDLSNRLDMSEMLQMFHDNDINITQQELEEFFSVIDLD